MPILVRKNVRVVLTAGGTGGHIYPVLAVADYLSKVGSGNIRLSFVGDTGTLRDEFVNRSIRIFKIPGAKLRRYFDFRTILDIPAFFVGLVKALVFLYFLMPDAVFSKGGPGSVPVVFAAWFYRIPILVHESDAAPSFALRLCSRFARRIGVSFEEAMGWFPEKKVFLSGHPVREEFSSSLGYSPSGAKLSVFRPDLPVLLVLGGSQGSVRINTFIVDSLPELLAHMVVHHQTGERNERDVSVAARLVLRGLASSVVGRYSARSYFSPEELQSALGNAHVVFSRAGAGAIFEIAAAGKPAVLLPLRGSANDHQRANAYAYAKTGAAVVIEEDNLTPHVFLHEVKKIIDSSERANKMGEAALTFARPDAAKILGNEILSLAGVRLIP